MTRKRPTAQDLKALRDDLKDTLNTTNLSATQRTSTQAVLHQTDAQLINQIEQGTDRNPATGESLVWAALEQIRAHRDDEGDDEEGF